MLIYLGEELMANCSQAKLHLLPSCPGRRHETQGIEGWLTSLVVWSQALRCTQGEPKENLGLTAFLEHFNLVFSSAQFREGKGR